MSESTTESTKPYVWQMISEAVNSLGGTATYSEIKEYIHQKWENVNNNTINAQIIVLSVNHKSRVHYPENKRPRNTQSFSNYDILYTIGRGHVTSYQKEKHGIWEIIQNADKLEVREVINDYKNTFLFAWNPQNWPWETLSNDLEEFENSGKVTLKWSCQSHRKIKIGDRAFLTLVGQNPRGIFASGYVVSEPFLSKHWSEDKDVYRVMIEFDALLNPLEENILETNKFTDIKMLDQQWFPQASGIQIKHEIVPKLEENWFKHISSKIILSHDDVEDTRTFTEGEATAIIQNRYERNPYARKKCIEYYGYGCQVCEMDFEKIYGDIGKNFIHVHHLYQISERKRVYEINPIKDLRPVCPNCHAMLHKQKSPITIELLKAMLKI